MESFEGKVAVVTGGGSGIGRGISLALANAGSTVVVADIDGEAAEQVAKQIDGRALQTDVTSNESVEALASYVASETGGVDIVCNNAGVYLGGDMRDTTEDDWRFVLSVNLAGDRLLSLGDVEYMVHVTVHIHVGAPHAFEKRLGALDLDRGWANEVPTSSHFA